ncbi:MAG: hypothetical protein N2Z70_06435 [Bdellovibrionaceae bacterium]|jgi:DNA-binding response OmpR family regulator|nr:hypothetical protein [Pseudobdellovibrionaceae bacterium]
MKLCLAIFEDDSELTELLQEMLSEHQYQLVPYLSLKQAEWHKIDLVLADYRNTIVSFAEVVKEAKKHGVPVIAISGAHMDHPIQLEKPFTMEELEGLIYKVLGHNFKPKSAGPTSVRKDEGNGSFWSKVFSGKKVS